MAFSFGTYSKPLTDEEEKHVLEQRQDLHLHVKVMSEVLRILHDPRFRDTYRDQITFFSEVFLPTFSNFSNDLKVFFIHYLWRRNVVKSAVAYVKALGEEQLHQFFVQKRNGSVRDGEALRRLALLLLHFGTRHSRRFCYDLCETDYLTSSVDEFEAALQHAEENQPIRMEEGFMGSLLIKVEILYHVAQLRELWPCLKGAKYLDRQMLCAIARVKNERVRIVGLVVCCTIVGSAIQHLNFGDHAASCLRQVVVYLRQALTVPSRRSKKFTLLELLTVAQVLCCSDNHRKVFLNTGLSDVILSALRVLHGSYYLAFLKLTTSLCVCPEVRVRLLDTELGDAIRVFTPWDDPEQKTLCAEAEKAFQALHAKLLPPRPKRKHLIPLTDEDLAESDEELLPMLFPDEVTTPEEMLLNIGFDERTNTEKDPDLIQERDIMEGLYEFTSHTLDLIVARPRLQNMKKLDSYLQHTIIRSCDAFDCHNLTRYLALFAGRRRFCFYASEYLRKFFATREVDKSFLRISKNPDVIKLTIGVYSRLRQVFWIFCEHSINAADDLCRSGFLPRMMREMAKAIDIHVQKSGSKALTLQQLPFNATLRILRSLSIWDIASDTLKDLNVCQAIMPFLESDSIETRLFVYMIMVRLLPISEIKIDDTCIEAFLAYLMEALTDKPRKGRVHRARMKNIKAKDKNEFSLLHLLRLLRWLCTSEAYKRQLLDGTEVLSRLIDLINDSHMYLHDERRFLINVLFHFQSQYPDVRDKLLHSKAIEDLKVQYKSESRGVRAATMRLLKALTGYTSKYTPPTVVGFWDSRDDGYSSPDETSESDEEPPYFFNVKTLSSFTPEWACPPPPPWLPTDLEPGETIEESHHLLFEPKKWKGIAVKKKSVVCDRIKEKDLPFQLANFAWQQSTLSMKEPPVVSPLTGCPFLSTSVQEVQDDTYRVAPTENTIVLENNVTDASVALKADKSVADTPTELLTDKPTVESPVNVQNTPAGVSDKSDPVTSKQTGEHASTEENGIPGHKSSDDHCQKSDEQQPTSLSKSTLALQALEKESVEAVRSTENVLAVDADEKTQKTTVVPELQLLDDSSPELGLEPRRAETVSSEASLPNSGSMIREPTHSQSSSDSALAFQTVVSDPSEERVQISKEVSSELDDSTVSEDFEVGTDLDVVLSEDEERPVALMDKPTSVQGSTALLNCESCTIESGDLRILPCMHYQCVGCIYASKSEETVKCNKCCKIFRAQQPGNFSLADFGLQMTALHRKASGEEVYCDICLQRGKHVAMVTHCLDCSEWLCDACRHLHLAIPQLARHNLLSFDELLDLDGFFNSKENLACDDHASRDVSHVCNTCDNLLCSLCLDSGIHGPGGAHRQHLPLSIAASMARLRLRPLLGSLQKPPTETLAQAMTQAQEQLHKFRTRVQEIAEEKEESLQEWRRDVENEAKISWKRFIQETDLVKSDTKSEENLLKTRKVIAAALSHVQDPARTFLLCRKLLKSREVPKLKLPSLQFGSLFPNTEAYLRTLADSEEWSLQLVPIENYAELQDVVLCLVNDNWAQSAQEYLKGNMVLPGPLRQAPLSRQRGKSFCAAASLVHLLATMFGTRNELLCIHRQRFPLDFPFILYVRRGTNKAEALIAVPQLQVINGKKPLGKELAAENVLCLTLGFQCAINTTLDTLQSAFFYQDHANVNLQDFDHVCVFN